MRTLSETKTNQENIMTTYAPLAAQIIGRFVDTSDRRPCSWNDVDNSCYSDLHKEAVGYRPRDFDPATKWKTVGDFYSEMEYLQAMILGD